MYRRYSQVNTNTVPVNQLRRNRIKNILILFLLAALIALGVFSFRAMQRESSARELHIQRMQSEISEAVRLTGTLSRNGGADSASTLARIRSNLYAIRVINDLNTAEEGPSGRLLPEETLSALQSDVDNYLSFLTTGMDTGEYQTSLQNKLSELMTAIGSLK